MFPFKNRAFLFAIFILVYQLGYAQLSWESYDLVQLNELSTNQIRSLTQSPTGVWIGGEPGIVFWHAESGNFVRPEQLKLLLVKKLEYFEGSLYVLTKAKQLLKVDVTSNGFVNAVFPLSPQGIIINDFDVDVDGLILGTALSGVQKLINGVWIHYNAGTSFLASNSIRAICWYGDKIAASSLGAVYLSDGTVIDSTSGLLGIQPYKLASRLSTLYVATENGINVFESNGQVETLMDDFILDAIVSAFDFRNGNALIATNKGVYNRSENGWERFVDIDQQGIRSSDALWFDNKLFIAYHAEGLDILHGKTLYHYCETATIWKLNQLFEWKGETYGLVNNKQLFYYDKNLDRLKLEDESEALIGAGKVISDGRGNAYVFTNRACVNLESLEAYVFPIAEFQGKSGLIKPFFSPEDGRPACLLQGTGLFLANDSGGFDKILSSPFVQGMQIGSVKNDFRGSAFFKHDAHIYRWSKGDLTDQGLFMDTLISFYDHSIQDVFFMREYPLYQTWDYFLYDGVKQTVKNNFDYGYVNPAEAFLIKDDRIFVIGESSDRMAVYAIDSLRTLEYSDLPGEAYQYRNAIVQGDDQVWLGYEDRIFTYKLEPYSIRPNKEEIVLYPNPSTGSLNLELSLKSPVAIELVIQSVDGSIHYTDKIQIDQIREKITINLPDLISGVYIVSITGFGVLSSKPFVLMN